MKKDWIKCNKKDLVKGIILGLLVSFILYTGASVNAQINGHQRVLHKIRHTRPFTILQITAPDNNPMFFLQKGPAEVVIVDSVFTQSIEADSIVCIIDVGDFKPTLSMEVFMAGDHDLSNIEACEDSLTLKKMAEALNNQHEITIYRITSPNEDIFEYLKTKFIHLSKQYRTPGSSLAPLASINV